MDKTLPSNAAGASLIPGQGAKILHASGPKNQNIKQKQYCNKFNKDFKKKKRFISKKKHFPGGAVVENLPANAGDMGLIPG